MNAELGLTAPTQSAGSSDLSTNTPGSWRKTSGSYHLTASLVEFHWDKSLSSCAWHDLSSCVMLDVCSLAVHWQPEEGGSVWSSKPGTNVLSSSSIPMPWELLSGATGLPCAGKHYQPGDEKSRMWLHLWMYRWNFSGRRYIFNHLLPFWCSKMYHRRHNPSNSSKSTYCYYL